MACKRMANQEFTVAQNIRRAPSWRTAHARSTSGCEGFTLAQNIRFAPFSRATTQRDYQDNVKIHG